jgi:polyisoprenoid-binding protein YceI
MLRFKYLIVFLLFLSVSHAQKSKIEFVIKNLGINVDGHFNTFSINSEIDVNLDLKSLDGKISVSSIETGIDSRDEHLLDEDYFNVNSHKYITLKSTSVTKTAENKYKVKADLSVKGKTKKITIPVIVVKTNNITKIISSFEINRKDYDVGGSSFVMSKTVKINVVHYQKQE